MTRPLTLLALVALVAVACQKPEGKPADGTAEKSATAATAGETAGKAGPANAAGEGVDAAVRVSECPKSLGGTDKVHRVISKDCGVVPVTEDYYVDGGSLTLEAGSSLSFKDGTGLYVGYYESAKLIVQGTAEAPVVLTAAGDKAAGVWRGVSLNEHAARSTIDGLVIEYAGNDESALYVAAADVSVKSSKIRDAKGTGLLIADSGTLAAFTDNELKKLGSKTAIAGPASAVGGLGAGNRFDPEAHILVRGGNLNKSATWLPAGAPLVIGGEVYVDGTEGQAAKLELTAGLELRFGEAGSLVVGYYNQAALAVKGTAEAPVTFTAHEKREAGGWGGVTVHGKGEATIEQAVFEFGGRDEANGVLAVRGGALGLKASTFRSDKAGVSVDEGSRVTAFADNKFAATPVAALLTANHVMALAESNAYDRDSRIKITGAAAIKGKATWQAQGVPIEWAGELYIDGELTLAGGVALLGQPDARLVVGYYDTAALLVKGTAAAPVTIGPADTANNSWIGISLAGKASGSSLENLVLTGASADAAIDVAGGVSATLSAVTCSKCKNAVVGWACGATVTSSQVLAADGTPKVDVRPEGC
ncbi:MAG: hypothetical protein IPO88_11615 [Nannocystis sp.]|uniref:hypothetical protein n=1 Tax=Nannocystis sp. TaxID=1962667 RepID=UPI00242618AF|nr:hypothetical protein [Nannocystis sp.]MBK9754134.1 hypothetical protein [Nannocystis sp.]